MVRRSKKKSPQFWQCHRDNPTIAPTSSDTVRAEINNDSVDQDASIENSRVSAEVDVLASEGTPVEDIALTHTVERSISHIENNAHAESDTAAPVCLEIEAVQPDNTTTTKAQYVLPDQVKQAQDIISSCLEESETAQKDAIDRAISLLYPYKPRDGQRDALHHLIYRRKDLILIAKTAFGKSMILQAVSILLRKSTAIILLPLNQIGEEQTQYITRIGGKPCFLNAETINRKLLDEVQGGMFTHILISPELAISDDFRNIACNPAFKERISLVVVDEAHLVSQWGRAFRPAYARLNQLRSYLGMGVPWFACSATLDSETLEALRKGVSFDADIKVQRTSIDRPELLIRTGWIPNKSGYSALRFLFSEDGKTPGSVFSEPHLVPKTIVFFDTRKDAYAAMEDARMWLQQSEHHHYSNRQILQAIKIFHRKTASLDKTAIISEFQKPGEESLIRVIFATEALGIGADLPDVPRVVQYGLPKGPEPAIMWQRGGRACRNGCDGETIILIDEWVDGNRSTQKPKNAKNRGKTRSSSGAVVSGGSVDEAQGPKKLTNEQRRANLPDFWYTLANSEKQEPPKCIRRQFLEHFQEPDEYKAAIRTDRCCSNCNPEYRLNKLDQFYLYHELGPRANNRTKQVLKALDEWAKDQMNSVYKGCAFKPVSTLFLSQDQRDRIAKNAHLILDMDSLRTALGSWYFFDTHGRALLDTLRNSYRQTQARAHNQPAIASQSQCLGLDSQTGLAQSVAPKRRALESISYNIPSKKRQTEECHSSTHTEHSRI